MKQIFHNRSFLKSIIYILLIGQFWVNAASYLDLLTDGKTTVIELYSCDKGELNLEDNKKDKVDTFSIASDFMACYPAEEIQSILNSEDFRSPHHPEIATPPPQFFILLS